MKNTCGRCDTGNFATSSFAELCEEKGRLRRLDASGVFIEVKVPGCVESAYKFRGLSMYNGTM